MKREVMSQAEFRRRFGRPKKRSKYNATVVRLDGYAFASQAEANRYAELAMLQQAGRISDLELQPRFELQAAFRRADGRHERAIEYIADFAYQQGGKRIVEDVKGHRTDVYALKRKLFLYRYPDVIFREVRT